MGDTRITGATNQQIEAGARSIGGRVINREYPDESDIAECEQMLSHFVGPDQRIVEVADLETIVADYGGTADPMVARLKAAIG